METTVTFEYGSLKVEISAQDDENYQDELLNLLDFIENHQERFEKIGSDSDAPGMSSDKTGSVSLEDFSTKGAQDKHHEDDSSSGPLSPIASELRVSVTELDKFLDVNPEEGNLPVFYVDELGKIGERQTDRQRVASLVLLYIWHECYGYDRVKSSDLKDALELSNVSSSGMANMYQGEGDRYFDRSGRGPSATVKLTPPGKRQARKILTRLVEEKEISE